MKKSITVGFRLFLLMIAACFVSCGGGGGGGSSDGGGAPVSTPVAVTGVVINKTTDNNWY